VNNNLSEIHKQGGFKAEGNKHLGTENFILTSVYALYMVSIWYISHHHVFTTDI